ATCTSPLRRSGSLRAVRARPRRDHPGHGCQALLVRRGIRPVQRVVARDRPSLSEERQIALPTARRSALARPHSSGRAGHRRSTRAAPEYAAGARPRPRPTSARQRAVGRPAPSVDASSGPASGRMRKGAMPRKRKKEEVLGKHFVWLLGLRSGVYYADGRSNQPDAGRHSLGTRSRTEALQALQRLDVVRAVALGLADQALLLAPLEQLSLAEGRRLYLQHVTRPRVGGGARPASAKRYRAVFDKFERFASGEGVSTWNQVDRKTLK